MARAWDKRSIQRQWQPIDFDRQAPLSAIELEYCRFYGIDFAQRMPGIEQGFGFQEVGDFRIATHCFRPHLNVSRGTLVLLHGYFDHAGLYGHLIEYCLKRHYSVLIYDLPGHGLSSGEPGGIDDFRHYVEVLDHFLSQCRGHFDEPWSLLGQSTGCSIIMEYLVSHRISPINNPFQNILLLAPLVRPVQWKKLLLLLRLSKRFVKSVKRQYMPCSSDPEFLNFLRREDPLQYRRVPLNWIASLISWAERFAEGEISELSPVVIQGSEDTTIDWRYNLKAIERVFTQPAVHFLPDARHHLVNEAQQIRDRLFDILDDYIK